MTIARESFLVFVLAVCVALVGCGKKDGEGEATTKVDSKALDDAVTAANAAVPPEWKGKLSFEKVTNEDGKVAGVVPSGWKLGQMDRYKPPSEELGFMTGYAASHSCDGLCEPKDWKPVVEKKFEQTIGGSKVVKDEALPGNGRIAVLSNQKSARVVAMWWKDGASHYVTCSAWLDHPELAKAIDAFEAACRGTQAVAW